MLIQVVVSIIHAPVDVINNTWYIANIIVGHKKSKNKRQNKINTNNANERPDCINVLKDHSSIE